MEAGLNFWAQPPWRVSRVVGTICIHWHTWLTEEFDATVNDIKRGKVIILIEEQLLGKED